jgi:polyketide biosynthesis enoyl-CoA hydratase PksI
MSSSDPVTLEVSPEGIAVLRLCDEKNNNALSEEMAAALDAQLEAAALREDIKTVVLAGLPECFCSGASREVLLKLADSRIAPGDLILPRRVLSIPVPTIAAMEGHAIGGGLALGICCDIVLAARESRYGCTFMNYGFTPGMGTTRLLEHVVSPALSHEMLFTGQTFRGREFEGRSGFNYILPRTDLWPKAMDLAARIAEKPRASLVLLKENLVSSRRKVYEDALAKETEMHRQSFAREDVVSRILEMGT